jgi:hypothetical protein
MRDALERMLDDGASYFRFDPRTQERQLTEMCAAMSVYAAGGEEAVKMAGAQSATPAATFQAAAHANHRGARSRAGELRNRGMTGRNKWPTCSSRS